MTVFRGDRGGRGTTLIAFAIVAFAVMQGAVAAQTRGPVSLIPPPTGGTDSAREEAPRAAEPTGVVRSIPGTDDSSVRIRGLGAVDADAVGLPGQDSGGLSAEMWRGTSRTLAERLVAAVPERLASAAAHDLARRLLLIAAEPPSSARGDTSLVKLRVEKLIAFGAAADAESLLRAVSARSLPENMVESAVEAHLLTSDLAGACQAMQDSDSGFVSEFSQKALVLCQLLEDKFSQAAVGLDLLREQGLTQDRLFFDLANAVIAGATPTAEQLAAPGQASALNLALVSVAGGEIPAWFVDRGSPSVLRAVAAATNASRETRLAAARRAAQLGGLSPVELADVYSGLGIGAEEVAAVLLDPQSASDALRLAVIYLAASSRDIAAARAEVLRETWHLAAAQGDWRLAVRVTAPQLRAVPPVPAFSWFAGEAMAASLAAGDADRALEWFEVAANRGAVDPAAAAAATAMWPALRMAASGNAVPQADTVQTQVFDQSGRRRTTTIPGAVILSSSSGARLPWNEGRVADWIALREGDAPPRGADAATVLALLDALGDPVSDVLWASIGDGVGDGVAAAAPLPPLDIWVGLQRAAAAGRVAETALYALLAVGESEMAQLHPATVYAVVGALQHVGLTEAARAMALEIAVTPSL